jgi:hypothetical protein
VHYQGNTGTIQGADGQIEVAPPREEIDILPYFDVFLSQQIFANAERLSCDGQQALEAPEGTLQGEALMVRLKDNEGQLFFDADDHIIGWKSERDLGVFENEYADDLLVRSSFRLYTKPEETSSVATATLARR